MTATYGSPQSLGPSGPRGLRPHGASPWGVPGQIKYFMKMYEGIIVQDRAQEQERKRKADERKRQQASGKTYTHNVKG